MSSAYVPWGQLDWLLPRLGQKKWSLLGVLGSEERCTATFQSLDGSLVQRCSFLNILDPAPEPQEDFGTRYKQLRAVLIDEGAPLDSFPEVPLLADTDTILDSVVAFLSESGPNVILDLTSMPKWWFFPTIRFLLNDARIENLIATYTSAASYVDQLASDPAPLAPLPTFDEPSARLSHDELIVAIGFAPLGLRDLFGAEYGKVRYLFPFPPGPPYFARNWEFLRLLEAEVVSRDLQSERPWAVNLYDCPSVFEALRSFTRGGERTAAFAPFGPKPVSLAMCLFALAASKANKPPVHVFYTQPRRYALDYSKGIRRVGSRADIHAYCIRLGSRDLYEL